MARASQARRVALSVLGEVRRRDARARDLLRASDGMAGLDERDRALASRLVLGCVGSWGLVRQVIGAHCKGHVEPKVLDALHLGAYELLFLSTPASVAVSQGVELVRSVRPRAAGLANAVLRRVAQEDAPARAASLRRVEDGTFDAGDLAMASGYPAWLMERVRADRGNDAARDMALSALEPAPVYVATNRALHADDEAEALLREAGLDPHDTGLAGSFALGRPAGLARSGLVEGVDVVVADLSAQRVAALAGTRPGMRVLEVGQGRGTKSVLLEGSALARGGMAHVVGVDSEPFKVEVAARRMERAGMGEHVRCLAYDGRLLASPVVPDDLRGPFDLVFVDAPCSGTGTLRRHPEICWSLSPSSTGMGEADSLPRLQLDLLAAAATRVWVGGVVCYATCSVLRAENEQVVGEFLASDLGRRFELEEPAFQSLPRAGAPDGHYCARLLRTR